MMAVVGEELELEFAPFGMADACAAAVVAHGNSLSVVLRIECVMRWLVALWILWELSLGMIFAVRESWLYGMKAVC